MNKKGKLSQVEKFYIENNRNTPVAEVARALSRSEKVVENHLKSVPAPVVETPPPPSPPAPKPENMFRKSMRAKDGITILSESVSQMGDEFLKKSKSKAGEIKIASKYGDCIFQPDVERLDNRS